MASKTSIITLLIIGSSMLLTFPDGLKNAYEYTRYLLSKRGIQL